MLPLSESIMQRRRTSFQNNHLNWPLQAHNKLSALPQMEPWLGHQVVRDTESVDYQHKQLSSRKLIGIICPCYKNADNNLVLSVLTAFSYRRETTQNGGMGSIRTTGSRISTTHQFLVPDLSTPSVVVWKYHTSVIKDSVTSYIGV